jgi:hypothetical protein
MGKKKLEDVLESKGLTLDYILKLKTEDGRSLTIVGLERCWNCEYEQEDTQTFCVKCLSSL